MNASDLVAAAAMAFNAYQQLGALAGRAGMDAVEFAIAVDAELERLNRWVATTNAAEDRVFRAGENTDQ